MEDRLVFKPLIKLFFIAKAAVEVGRERLEDCLDAVTSRATEYKSYGSEHIKHSKDIAQEYAYELGQQIWHRSEVLESQFRERIRRQVADFSLGALGDSTEINELRAEIATLRAEIADLKSMRAAV